MTLRSRMDRVFRKVEELAELTKELRDMIPEKYLCRICKKVVDISKDHVIVFIEKKEVPHHVECFYKDYTVEVEGKS